MTVTAVQCPNCKALIYSRARHDYRNCPCGDTAVDGGFEYLRTSFKKVPPISFRLPLKVSRKTLYDDWNCKYNKYGIIPSNQK